MKDLTLSYTETMLEQIPVGVALFDASTFQLLDASPSFHALLDPNWQQGQAIGHSLTEFLSQMELSDSDAIFQQVVETGIAYQSDASVTFSSNHTYWNWSVKPVKDANGQVIQLLLTLIETTVQVLAQQKVRTILEQTNQKLKVEQQRLMLLEAITKGISKAIWAEQIAEATLDVINESFQPLSAALYTTDSARQYFRALALTLPPTKQFARSALTRIAYNRSSLLYQAMQKRSALLSGATDEKVRGAEGLLHVIPEVNTTFWLPLWYDEYCEGILVVAFAQEMHIDAPQIRALEGCARPLAEALSRARLRAIIEQERQRLHTMLDQLPEGILLVEAASGTISYANSAASSLLEVPHQSLMGTPLHRLGSNSENIKPSSPSNMPWNFALVHALGGKTVNAQELTVSRPDGAEAILLSSAAPIRRNEGIITEAIIVFQDITVSKTIEQQKSLFLTMINHELRTPLTAVLGFSELLQEQEMEGLKPLQIHAIAAIVKQSENLQYLVDEILDHSSFRYDAFTLNTTYQDLLPLLIQAVDRCAQTNKSYKIQFNVDSLPTTAYLMGWFDEQRIAQILNNVLINAVKYSHEHELIELGVKLHEGGEEDEVLLWIKDQGIGITTNDLPHIFEQFYRGEKRDRVVSGLGLGLYLAKEFVQRHGGHIWVESTVDVGSTFFIVLPLK